MPIKVGDKLPSVTFKEITREGLKDVTTDEFFAGKKTLLFGIPGAFTPVCQGNHVPGYVGKYDEFMSKGIDQIACISVNDCFVMKAFGEAQNAVGKIAMLADDSAVFTKEIGLDADVSSFGLGTRCERYAMVIDNGVVELLAVEKNFVDHDLSSAEKMLAHIAA
jgi:glutaredoxin/glutathione-dependent peroxiredoxin